MQTVFFVTKLSTTGGLLRRKNVTLLIVTEDENVPKVLEIIKNNSVSERLCPTLTQLPCRIATESVPSHGSRKHTDRRQYCFHTECGTI